MRHIYLTCKNHPKLLWFCKSIAVNRDGSYNGLRHIFYEGDGSGRPPECPCSPSDLTFRDDAERETWKQDTAE